MKTKMLKLPALTLLAMFVLGTPPSFAESVWARNHPRRHEVNARLNNQNRRIHDERREGEITKAQARRLHREDRRIRGEERIMASQHNGHITRQEQTTLNRQENFVSRQIGR